MIRRSFVLVAATLAALFLSSAYAEKTGGESVDDSAIATKAKNALIQDKQVSAGDINVEVYKGKVLLAGFIGSEAEKAAAIAAAQKVEGAKQVLDGLVVLPGKRSAGQTLDDQTLQTKLKSKLVDEQGLGKGMNINTEVRQGEVLMSGFVPDQKYKTKAGEVAQGISGVKKVHNEIEVQN